MKLQLWNLNKYQSSHLTSIFQRAREIEGDKQKHISWNLMKLSISQTADRSKVFPKHWKTEWLFHISSSWLVFFLLCIQLEIYFWTTSAVAKWCGKENASKWWLLVQTNQRKLGHSSPRIPYPLAFNYFNMEIDMEYMWTACCRCRSTVRSYGGVSTRLFMHEDDFTFRSKGNGQRATLLRLSVEPAAVRISSLYLVTDRWTWAP